MPLLYRYISNADELLKMKDRHFIQTLNPLNGYLTFFTPDLYQNADEAQKKLALPKRPLYRIGPIYVESLEDFDVAVQTVNPAFEYDGGGKECATRNKLWLLRVWNLDEARWEDI